METTKKERKMDRRAKPSSDGSWVKIGRKHYRHESGIEIIYLPNAWLWQIVGGRSDGLCFTTLTVAQHHATVYLRTAIEAKNTPR